MPWLLKALHSHVLEQLDRQARAGEQTVTHTIAADRGNRIIQMSVAGWPGSDRTKANWFEIRRSGATVTRRRTDQSQWRSRKSLPIIGPNRATDKNS
jgi:hypothetical protein